MAADQNRNGQGTNGKGPGRGAHLPEIASQGGQAVVKKYGPEYMSQIGKRGAKTVAEKYGPDFYAQMGARNKGVKKRRRGRPQPAPAPER